MLELDDRTSFCILRAIACDVVIDDRLYMSIVNLGCVTAMIDHVLSPLGKKHVHAHLQ